MGEQGEVYHLLCNLIFEVTYYHFAIRSQSLGPAHIQGHGYQESGILRGCFRGYPPQCYCLTDLYKSFYLKYYLLETSTIILVVILVYDTYILTIYYLSKLNFSPAMTSNVFKLGSHLKNMKFHFDFIFSFTISHFFSF